MGVGYRQAREALAATDGNVVDALVHLEQQQDYLDTVGRAIAARMSEVMVGDREITDVRVKVFDSVVLNMPTAVVGLAAALTVLAGEVLTHCSVDIEYRGATDLQGTAEVVVTDQPQD